MEMKENGRKGKKKRNEWDERADGRARLLAYLLVCLLARMPFDIFMRIGHLKDKCEPTNQDNGNIKTKSIQTRAKPLNKFSSSAAKKKEREKKEE